MASVYDTVCAAIKTALDAVYVKKSSTSGLLKNDGSVDTNSYQQQLVSGSNIKTVNNETLLGSGNISISGGGGGGSYINDFYGDSSTNELVIDYDTGVSQADIVTSWSSTVSDTNVPSEKLTKNSLDGKANSSHNHNITDLNNVTTVDVVVTYSNNTSETIKLMKYTGS